MVLVCDIQRSSSGVWVPVWIASGMGHWQSLIKIPGDTDCYYCINHMTCSMYVYYCSYILVTFSAILVNLMYWGLACIREVISSRICVANSRLIPAIVYFEKRGVTNTIEFLLSNCSWIRVVPFDTWIQVACSWIRIIITYLKVSSGSSALKRDLASVDRPSRFPICVKWYQSSANAPMMARDDDEPSNLSTRMNNIEERICAINSILDRVVTPRFPKYTGAKTRRE